MPPRVSEVRPACKDGEGRAAAGERATVRGGVDSERQSADHSHACDSKPAAHLLRDLEGVRRWTPPTDHGYAGLSDEALQPVHAAPDVQRIGRVAELHQAL